MSAPKVTPRLRKALLEAVAASDEHRKAAIALYEVQEKARALEAASIDANRKAIELWKKDVKQPGSPYGHVLLPDGRMACLQEGSITVWDLTRL